MKYTLPLLFLTSLACSVETMSHSSNETVAQELGPGVKAKRYDWTQEKGDRNSALSIVVCFPSTATHFDGHQGTTADPWRREVELREDADGEKIEIFSLTHDLQGDEIVINGKKFDVGEGKIFVVTRKGDRDVVQLEGEASKLEEDRQGLAAEVARVLGS